MKTTVSEKNPSASPKAAKSPDKHRILLVDDHPVTRQGVSVLLNQESDLTVAGEADSAPAAIAFLEICADRVCRVDLLSHESATHGMTPERGEIDVKVTTTDGQLVALVSDTGIGIDPGFVPRLFSRFEQADRSTTRPYDGLGLGLAIVRHLVELHGGTVQASSEGNGRGATFTVTLPMRTRAADVVQAGGARP